MGRPISTPPELDAAGIKPSVRLVWIALHWTVTNPRMNRFKVCKTDQSIADEIVAWGLASKISDRTVSEALGTLEQLGFIARREHERIPNLRIIWCRWRWTLPGRSAMVALPYGVETPVEAPPAKRPARRRSSSTAAAADLFGPSAENCARPAPDEAQNTADKLNTGFEEFNVNVHANVFEPGIQGNRDDADAPGGPVEAGTLRNPSPAMIEAARERLAATGPRHVALVKFEIWIMIHAGLGHEIPAKFPATSWPEEPDEPKAVPARTAIAASAPASATAPAPERLDLAALQTETIVYRLRELDPEQAEAAVQLVADRIVKRWVDGGSRNNYVKKLRQVAGGAIPTQAFLAAYRLADAALQGPENKPNFKGRLFNAEMRPFVPGKLGA